MKGGAKKTVFLGTNNQGETIHVMKYCFPPPEEEIDIMVGNERVSCTLVKHPESINLKEIKPENFLFG